MSQRVLVPSGAAAESADPFAEGFDESEAGEYAAGEPRVRRPIATWVIVLAALLAVGAGIGIWDAVKYRFIPKRFGEVLAGSVYRSGQISRWQFAPTVAKHGIDVVIDLNGIEPGDEDQQAEIAAYERLGLENFRFPLSGNGTGVVENYVAAIATLAERHAAGKTVLVHCHAGTQRTGSVVAAFRVLVLGQDPHDAYEELLKYGWNPDKDQVLLQYLNGNMRHVAEQLVERGVISQVPDPLPVVGP